MLQHVCLTTLAALVVTATGCTERAPTVNKPGAQTTTQEEPKVPQPTANTFDLVVTRAFDAKPEQVWKAWSDPEQVMRWWGPTGFTSPTCRMDFREGGTSLVCMRAPKAFGGQDMYNTWSYTRIVPTERIEFTLRFADKDANALDPAAMGLPPGIPPQVPHEITFKPLPGGKTEVTVRERGYTNEQAVGISKLGLEQCLDKMAASFANP